MGYEVDFLPVGEDKSGDAITLRFGNLFGRREEQVVVVIDGGFTDCGDAVVNHLKTFYGTTKVDLVVSTHSDADHAAGLETVLATCDVGQLWMHQPWNHTDDIAKMFTDGRVTDNGVREALRKSLDNARAVERIATSRKIEIVEPFVGVSDASKHAWVIGPSKEYYESLLPNFRGAPGPIEGAGLLAKAFRGVEEVIKKIAENWNIETLDDAGETSAENNSSVVLLVIVDDSALLFTADAGIQALTAAVNLLDRVGFDLSKIKFIQVPHHGSRRNVGPAILNRLIGPRLQTQTETAIKTAFVSVAKAEDSKHPSKKVTNAFKRRGAPVHATGGISKYHFYQAPSRGWAPSVPLPFYREVDE
jgi:beta-lactamase superfamily II metal-dependent hydrolase